MGEWTWCEECDDFFEKSPSNKTSKCDKCRAKDTELSLTQVKSGEVSGFARQDAVLLAGAALNAQPPPGGRLTEQKITITKDTLTIDNKFEYDTGVKSSLLNAATSWLYKK